MDLALILGAAVFLGLVTTVLWARYLASRKAKPEKRGVGYRRDEIIIDPRAVPEFRPTWREKREAR
jgi:hypothetical protein